MRIQMLFVIFVLYFGRGFTQGSVQVDGSCPVNLGFEGNVPYHTFKIGSISCMVVSDGVMHFPREKFFVNIDKVAVDRSGEFFHIPFLVQPFVNPMVCKFGEEHVLFDAGTMGRLAPETSGKLEENLKKSGIQPEQISKIIITHFHGDHIGGLLTDNSRVIFPNAEIFVSKADFEFYTNESNSNFLYYEQVNFIFPGLEKLGIKITQYSAGPLLEGVEMIHTPGHTPGHHIIKIFSGENYFYYVGDIIFNEMNVANSERFVVLDNDREKAAKTRAQFLSKFAEEKALLSVYHINFPGLGFVQKNGDSFIWIPKQWEF